MTTSISSAEATKRLNLFCKKMAMYLPEFPIRLAKKQNAIVPTLIGPNNTTSAMVLKSLLVDFRKYYLSLPELPYQAFKNYYKKVLDLVSNVQ